MTDAEIGFAQTEERNSSVSVQTSVLVKVTKGSREESSSGNDQSSTLGQYNLDYLTPHSMAARNSFSSATDYLFRRRRPISLKIMPRLSLPGKCTSAPATTTNAREWSTLRWENGILQSFVQNSAVGSFLADFPPF
ncbi:UNVERIFIED_CONTAM: hypothetical protein PYX00_005020 [Menopon gallinae]|uniref:Uncharacterized protein n=1 Tax=Menopon gallinae TaxID=328185 RepID=A0AAW2I6A3_9NEOP